MSPWLILFLIFVSLLILIAILHFIGTAIYAGIIASPYLGTPKNKIRQALKIASLKPGERFYDLGSGDGRSLIIANREYKAQAVGFELWLFLYFWSKLSLLFHHCSKNVKVYWKNFYQADISQADVIFCFLTPRAFYHLEEKFKRELKNGTRIVTFSSPLKFWEPQQIIVTSNKIKLFFYIKK